MTKLIASLAVASLAGSALAAGQFAITEIYPGVSGPDGTEDWFELTNIGDMALSTTGLRYDDESADFAISDALDAFTVNPGESVVVILNDGTQGAAASEFDDLWKSDINGINVIEAFSTDGNLGGLSQNGDSITIFDSAGNVILTQSFTNGFIFDTIDLSTGTAIASDLGRRGAFESNTFDSDGVDVNLIGSPGVIPAPGAAALLGLGGLAATRRRR